MVFDVSKHWFWGTGRKYPENIKLQEWLTLYPNFMPKEVASGPNHQQFIVYKSAMNGLQAVRNELDLPMVINSAYRTKYHNTAVGGSPRSQHLLGRAFDIDLSRFRDPQGVGNDIEDLATRFGFTGFGRYPSFIHIDMRDGPVAVWDLR